MGDERTEVDTTGRLSQVLASGHVIDTQQVSQMQQSRQQVRAEPFTPQFEGKPSMGTRPQAQFVTSTLANSTKTASGRIISTGNGGYTAVPDHHLQSHMVNRSQAGGHRVVGDSYVSGHSHVVHGGHNHVVGAGSQIHGGSRVVSGGHSHVVQGGHSHVVGGSHVSGGARVVGAGSHVHGGSRLVTGHPSQAQGSTTVIRKSGSRQNSVHRTSAHGVGAPVRQPSHHSHDSRNVIRTSGSRTRVVGGSTVGQNAGVHQPQSYILNADGTKTYTTGSVSRQGSVVRKV